MSSQLAKSATQAATRAPTTTACASSSSAAMPNGVITVVVVVVVDGSVSAALVAFDAPPSFESGDVANCKILSSTANFRARKT